MTGILRSVIVSGERSASKSLAASRPLPAIRHS